VGVYFFCYAQATETIKKEKEKEINPARVPPTKSNEKYNHCYSNTPNFFFENGTYFR